MEDNDHLTNEQRAAYWQRTLPPATLLAVSDHLQECTNCREELRRDKPAVAPNEPVPYEDLVAWMDGKVDPPTRHELAERIGDSPNAAADLVSLLQFRDEVREHPAAAPLRNWRHNLQRAWPLAAGLLIGGAFMWWSATLQRPLPGLALVDGGRPLFVRLNGEIPALGPLPAALQQSVHDALSLGKVRRPAILADLRGPSENLASAPAATDALRVIEPVETTVDSDRPVLRWSAEPGATGYRVNLLPAKGGALRSSPLLPAKATSWSPNEPLLPNETYEWEVEALHGNDLLAKAPAPPAPEARFRVLDLADRNELQQVRQKWGASHLVMGFAYANAGLLPEARKEFEALAGENPQSKLPKELLASLTN